MRSFDATSLARRHPAHNLMAMPAANACPVCDRPMTTEFKPFCSQGCRDRDLIAWLDGNRAIPGPPAEETED